MLLGELQHRTRNLLAVVQAIEHKTLRNSGSLEEFAVEFGGRLRALSRVQALLAEADYGVVELRALLDAELEAHGEPEPGKLLLTGPRVLLPANSAQIMALALHELTTNAVKYGALRDAAGRLAVTWQIESSAPGERRVVLDWQESGVHMPQAGATRKGYGSELIERALPYQLKAQTKLEFGLDGVHCRIAAPLPDEEIANA